MLLWEYKSKLMVVYVILPLMVVSSALPTIIHPYYHDNTQSLRRIPTLGYAAMVGLMSSDSKSESHYVHEAVKEVFEKYNEYYGNYYGPSYNWPIGISCATDGAATLGIFKDFLKYTDRVHIAAHGRYSTRGPQITLHDGPLNTQAIDKWNKIDGKCLLVFFSVCHSLGKGDGDIYYPLVDKIKYKSNVRIVIGYSGEVDVIGATFLQYTFGGNTSLG